MNSIRPLVTITILTLVGVFVYLNIKDGPASTTSNDTAWNDTPGVPTLQTTQSAGGPTDGGGAPLAAGPNWAATMPNEAGASYANGQSAAGGATTAAPSPWETAATQRTVPVSSTAAIDMMDPEPGALPDVPDLPEIPPLVQPLSTTATNNRSALPSDIPVARYPDEDTAQLPSGGGEAAGAASMTAISGSNPTSTAALWDGPPPANPDGDRPVAETDTTSLPSPPAGSPSSAYAVAKQSIQAALDRGELSHAHLMLSQWHGDKSLLPSEQQEVELLLSQLAGTVIYSTEHHLEPAYTVQTGETLETIADRLKVPWQLLAKINGISRLDGVQPGQQLKVVNGPFMAVVRTSAAELTLLLEGRYAGEFSVSLPPNTNVGEGTWLVEKKLLTPGAGGVTQVSTAYVARTPVLDRVLVLRSAQPGVLPDLLTLGSNSSSSPMPAAGTPASIQLSVQDAEDLYDILSVGSHVVIRH